MVRIHPGLTIGAVAALSALFPAFATSASASTVRQPGVGAPAPRSLQIVSGTSVYSFGVEGGGGKMRPLEHNVPTEVQGIPGHIVEVASSNSDSYALTAAGTVWAWGAGRLGELGNGSTPRYSGVPVEVGFPPGVRITSLPNPMPYNSGLAIDSEGHLWGWGYNPHGALCMRGWPLLWPKRMPVSNVTMASGAGDHTIFLSNGQVYACGLGNAGELGDGSRETSLQPVAVVGLPPGVVSLVSSWQGSGALLANGSYYDWGFNREGQMGNGTTLDALVPVRVPLPAAVVQVWQGGSNAGNGQTLALLANGSVWAWGAGGLGQLGDGMAQDSPVPVRVDLPAGVRFTQVCSGGDTSYALTSQGVLWSWGGNLFGQLGNGSSGAPRLVPAPVAVKLTQISATATNVIGLAA